jgi:hypothetical protein
MYVDLLSRASTTVHNVDETVTAINQSFDDPRHNSEARRAVAAEMFYKPGSATERAVSEMYKVLELDSAE